MVAVGYDAEGRVADVKDTYASIRGMNPGQEAEFAVEFDTGVKSVGR